MKENMEIELGFWVMWNTFIQMDNIVKPAEK